MAFVNSSVTQLDIEGKNDKSLDILLMNSNISNIMTCITHSKFQHITVVCKNFFSIVDFFFFIAN